MQVSVGVLGAGAAAALALGGAALAYAPPAQDTTAQPSAVINTSRSNIKSRAAEADAPQPTAIINTSRSNIKGQRVAAPGQGGPCPADRASSDPNMGCGDAAADNAPYRLVGPRCEHAINTKGTGATGRATATGETAGGGDPLCMAINEKGTYTAKDKKK